MSDKEEEVEEDSITEQIIAEIRANPKLRVEILEALGIFEPPRRTDTSASSSPE